MSHQVYFAQYALRYLCSDQPLTPAEQKRQLWHNDVRNLAIASIAMGVAQRDHDLLEGYGLRLRGNAQAEANLTAGWVLLLVDSAAHAHELGKLLPVFNVTVLTNTIRGRKTELHATGDIATTLATTLGAFTPSVIVNARGGRWIPNLEPLTRRLCGTAPTIIDLEDEFDAAAAEATTRRVTRYRLAGHEVIGMRQSELNQARPKFGEVKEKTPPAARATRRRARRGDRSKQRRRR
jgi:hypothetical protein